MSTSKLGLIAQLIEIFKAELANLKKSADAAADAATHPENKPENKYDTRGLEASYLAGAQRARAGEIIAGINLLESMAIRDFSDDEPVTTTALVEVENEGVRLCYFLMLVGAGHRLQHEERPVTVISPHSPLGQALLGKRAGDAIQLRTSQGVKDYEIVSIR